MFIQTQNYRELRVVLYEPSLNMKELWRVRNGLAKPGVQLNQGFSQSSLEPSVLSPPRLCLPILFDKEK
jgi:hypothetical protein